MAGDGPTSQALWPLTVPRAVERIRARNPTIHAYVTTRLDEALREAERANGRSPRSAIDGVPYGLKDEWDTAGIPTTGGSHRHRGRIPATSSPLFSALDSAGAILVGKTNLSDMGLAPEATNFIAGATRNPLDPRRTAGGSSGGAAAAVADGMQSFDWGTDIGGSIRLPAAFCGILGMRLSHATWPIQGAFPMPPASLAWMCGQGPMTRTIGQMRVLLDLTAPALRAGAPRPFFARRAVLYSPDRPGRWPTFERDVGPLVQRVMGAPRLGSDLPSTRAAQKVFVSLWASHLEDLLEADESFSFASGLRATIASAVFRGRLGDRGLHPSTGELIALMAIGRYTIFRDRDAPIREATTIRQRFEALWDEGTIVVAPVCVHPTPRVGHTNWNPDLLSCTIPGNLADATAISIPFGTFADGLPRAVQLMGPPGSELVIVDLAERLVGSMQRPA